MCGSLQHLQIEVYEIFVAISGNILCILERATEDEIKKIFFGSLAKWCDLDHIPTSVLKIVLTYK